MEHININDSLSRGRWVRKPVSRLLKKVRARSAVQGLLLIQYGLLLLLLLSVTQQVWATTIIVNTMTDGMVVSGNCSITEAVAAANTNTSVDGCPAGQSGVVDAIIISVQGTIEINSTLIVTESLLITGVNPNSTILNGRNQRQIFRISMDDIEDDFTLTNVTLEQARGGNTSASIAGGAVQLFQGNEFIFTNVHFMNNVDFIDSGGAIYAGPFDDNDNARLRVTNCSFINNSAERGGGAIYSVSGTTINGAKSLSSLIIESSEFIDNRDRNDVASASSGGALYLFEVGSVLIENSQFIDNSAPPAANGNGTGGAIYMDNRSSFQQSSSLIVRGTSFIGNTAAQSGGAISLARINASIENSTFTMNETDGFSSSALLVTGGTNSSADIRYSTFYENGDNISGVATIVCDNCELINLLGNIIWTSQPDDNECEIINGNLISLGGNIDGSGSCATNMEDLPMTDPLLLPLDDYSDNVDNINLLTLPPRSSSPAIDLSGDNGDCPRIFGLQLTNDQRNFQRPRVISDAQRPCDAGAVEFQPGIDPVDQRLNINFNGDGGGTVTSVSDNLECSDTCSRFFVAGTMLTLQATPAPGSRFVGWGTACSGTGNCAVTLNSTIIVIAEFEEITFPLTIDIMGAGLGRVTSDIGNIDCPDSSCSDDFPVNTEVRLTAVPDPGSDFIQWQGCNSQVDGDCIVTINQNRQIGIVFGVEPQELNIDFIGNGSGLVRSVQGEENRGDATDQITCQTDCSALVPFNLLFDLEAIADEDSEFIGWGGDCSGMDLCTVRMDQMRNVTAEFALTGFSLEVVVLGEGDGSVSSNINGVNCPGTCTFVFPMGIQVELNATAASNSVFSNWSNDCSGTQICRVTMNENRRVVAVFNPDNPGQVFINGFE